VIFAIDSPQFCQAPRGTDGIYPDPVGSLCSEEEGNKPNAAVGDSHSIDELNRVSRRSVGLSISPRLPLFRAEPFNAPLSIVLTPVFSHSCELFLPRAQSRGARPYLSGAYILCFHILTNSFAYHKITSPLFSCNSTLFRKNTQGWGHCFQRAPRFAEYPALQHEEQNETTN